MFNLIPDIVNDGKLVKNFFRKVKLRDDAFSYTTAFIQYNVRNGETPEDVSFAMYGDIKYYWIILLINDIQNVNKDWYMSEERFEEFIRTKYPTDLGNTTKHFATKELVVDNQVILPSGLIVDEDFTYNYKGVTYSNLTDPITYREWEFEQNENKRRIFILKNNFLTKYETEFKELLKYDTEFGIVNGVRLSNV